MPDSGRQQTARGPEKLSRLRACIRLIFAPVAAALTVLAATSLSGELELPAAIIAALGTGCAVLLGQALQLSQSEVRRLGSGNRDWDGLYSETLRSLAIAIDARDCHGSDHVTIVELVATKIAQEMGLSADEVQGIRTAALLLDVGTLGVPEHILLQKGRPSLEEFQAIHNHPIIGAQILEGIPFPWPVQKYIRSHHERWDGTGYPDRVSGTDIPLGARILAVADVYGAVTSKRTYSSGWTHSQAVTHIRIMSGAHFDPAIVSAFLRISEQISQSCDEVESAPSERAAAAISRVNQQFVALWEISQLVSSSLDLSSRLENVAPKIATALDCDACAIFLNDENGSTISCVTAWPHEASELLGARARIGQSGTGHVAFERRSTIVRQSRDTLETTDGTPIELDYEWAAIAPLRIQNTVLGTVNLYRRHKEFTIEDLDLLDTLARHASVPVAHASIYEATRESADRDPLTGLFNLRFFCAQIEHEVARANRLNHAFSIVAVDLNHFKAVNDTLGHPAGDALLRDMARLFTTTVRDYDSVVRYGGDEFVIILPETGAEQARETIDRLACAVEEYVSSLPGLQSIDFGASFGAATFGEDGRDVKSLLSVADERMYANKNDLRRTRLTERAA
ncbi:MAG: diguanylate cyclase [Armatimonadetes bacterium]|nr:diguanylate cyclase [Armatimonadota bacterium]